jgi:hypothetical protein
MWMSCQPREPVSGFVLAFSAGSEIRVPEMACTAPADRPELVEALSKPRNDWQRIIFDVATIIETVETLGPVSKSKLAYGISRM